MGHLPTLSCMVTMGTRAVGLPSRLALYRDVLSRNLPLDYSLLDTLPTIGYLPLSR